LDGCPLERRVKSHILFGLLIKLGFPTSRWGSISNLGTSIKVPKKSGGGGKCILTGVFFGAEIALLSIHRVGCHVLFVLFQEKKGTDAPKGPEVEIQKLEKILALVREPEKSK
jgi:hypothetical protein